LSERARPAWQIAQPGRSPRAVQNDSDCSLRCFKPPLRSLPSLPTPLLLLFAHQHSLPRTSVATVAQASFRVHTYADSFFLPEHFRYRSPARRGSARPPRSLPRTIAAPAAQAGFECICTRPASSSRSFFHTGLQLEGSSPSPVLPGSCPEPAWRLRCRQAFEFTRTRPASSSQSFLYKGLHLEEASPVLPADDSETGRLDGSSDWHVVCCATCVSFCFVLCVASF